MTSSPEAGSSATSGARPPRSFLILHGWQGSGPEHWQTWLAGRLRARGEQVSYPALPDPDTPRLEAWLAALAQELGALPEGERVVLCHSLSGVLWLHHAAAGVGPPVARVLLVAPPCASAGEPAVAGFFPAPLDPGAVARAAGETRLVCAAGDPFCPEGAEAAYARPLGLPVDVIPGGGHLNADAGYGPWPAAEAWALDGAVPLVQPVAS